MEDLQFRLIYDNKIVGYEKHEVNSLGNMSIMQARRLDRYVHFSLIEGHTGILHDAKHQYTTYKDFDDKMIYDEDFVEIDGGSFVGMRMMDRSLHKIKWDPKFGGWAMIGINVFLEDGVTPCKNLLNAQWVNKIDLPFSAYPLRVVGNPITTPELLKVTMVFSQCEELGHVPIDDTNQCACAMRRVE